MATGREHFACQESIPSQIFILLISNGEKNVVVCGQVKNENSSILVAVRVSKPRMLKLPYFYVLLPSRATRVSRWPRFRYCSPKIRQKLRLFCRLNEHAAWTLHEYYMNIHLHAARAQHITIAFACFISAHG